jgi:acyl carrier protein
VLSSAGIEAQIRRVVARELGVPARVLEPGVSLRDDLVVDGRAVADVVLAVEARLGVRMDERVLDEVRSYGELVRATLEAVRTNRERMAEAGREAPRGRVRIVGPSGLVLERSGEFTPYVLEGIAADARRAGRGSRLIVTTGPAATDAQLDWLRERLTGLARLGVILEVGRGSGASPLLRTSS